MFDSHNFSKDLKIQKSHYQYSQEVDKGLLNKYLHELKDFDTSSLKNDFEKIAFWINVYNGMTNYVIITSNIQKSMKEVEGIFRKKIFSISDMEFSLDDIEHGILRRNKRNMFSPIDKKRPLMVEKLDHRIHFALNCGAQSCPLISFYSAENINQELSKAEKVFVESEFLVNHSQKEVICSPLFDWYREDFQGIFLEDSSLKNYTIMFKEYDWSI